jgi:outer membrane protein TolC
MSREPAGAVILAANQRLKCFCRTRIFSFSQRHWLALAVTAMVVCSTLYAGTSTSRQRTDSSARIFTLNQAVETALQRNPDILRARQEIQRTKGVEIEVRAQALPHLDAAGFFRKIDPNLQSSGGNNFVTVTGTPGATATPTATPSATVTPTPSVPPGTRVGAVTGTTNSYDLTLTATQLLYNGSVIPAIRGAAFSRDAAFFSLSNIIDQVIATTRVQFYQVLLNKQLIDVQEESVRLLESQLKDQQNRFEAGTVPRFNVLQAEVALANQQPALITAQNNLRIAQLQLAKTIGLDFNPVRGDQPPLEVRGELSFEPREIPLTNAIELGKARRPFLKQQRANVLIQLQQVQGAYAGYQPILNLNGGYEWASSPFSDSIGDVDKGWFFGLTGSWPIFDGLQTYGQVKQQRALLSEARITYDDAVRQVELEIQQAYSNLEQDRQLVAATSKTVEQAREALRLASARLGVGAGVQLDVLNAQVALTQAQSTRLQALSSYNSDQAEFDRATATDTVYHAEFEDPLTRKRRETRMTKTTTTAPQRVQPSGK